MHVITVNAKRGHKLEREQLMCIWKDLEGGREREKSLKL